eukprot:767006-Hanusia_phi.AAC.2
MAIDGRAALSLGKYYRRHKLFVVDEEFRALESHYDVSICGCKSDPRCKATEQFSGGLVRTALLGLLDVRSVIPVSSWIRQ